MRDQKRAKREDSIELRLFDLFFVRPLPSCLLLVAVLNEDRKGRAFRKDERKRERAGREMMDVESRTKES